jgi:hypothetical protein
MDGPKDTSQTIQISIIIRYYFNYATQEKSSGVHAKETIHANSLISYRLLKATLKKSGIHLQTSAVKISDSANVKSGGCSKEQSLLRKKCLKLLMYTV